MKDVYSNTSYAWFIPTLNLLLLMNSHVACPILCYIISVPSFCLCAPYPPAHKEESKIIPCILARILLLSLIWYFIRGNDTLKSCFFFVVFRMWRVLFVVFQNDSVLEQMSIRNFSEASRQLQQWGRITARSSRSYLKQGHHSRLARRLC